VELDRVNLPLRLVTMEINRICLDLERVVKDSEKAAETNSLDRISKFSSADDECLRQVAKEMIRERKRRQHFFPNAQFAEPVWDILLDLFLWRLSGRQISVTSTCIASGVPPTTALRYISQLTQDGLLVRLADPKDERRIYLQLSDETTNSMKEYLLAQLSDRG
jgi:hypothetical protein